MNKADLELQGEVLMAQVADMQKSLEIALAIIERQHGYLVQHGIDPKTGVKVI